MHDHVMRWVGLAIVAGSTFATPALAQEYPIDVHTIDVMDYTPTPGILVVADQDGVQDEALTDEAGIAHLFQTTSGIPGDTPEPHLIPTSWGHLKATLGQNNSEGLRDDAPRRVARPFVAAGTNEMQVHGDEAGYASIVFPYMPQGESSTVRLALIPASLDVELVQGLANVQPVGDLEDNLFWANIAEGIPVYVEGSPAEKDSAYVWFSELNNETGCPIFREGVLGADVDPGNSGIYWVPNAGTFNTIYNIDENGQILGTVIQTDGMDLRAWGQHELVRSFFSHGNLEDYPPELGILKDSAAPLTQLDVDIIHCIYGLMSAKQQTPSQNDATLRQYSNTLP